MTNATAAQLATPTDLDEAATMTVADALKIILANSYAVYLKTKNFHWHVSGPYFRDYHLCQTAFKRDPRSASKRDPLFR